MDKRTVEAVAEAIVHTSGYWSADNSLYEARNPGGLLAFSPAQSKDEKGFRIFASCMDGMQALIFDVQLKLTGKARAKLKPTNTLSDFAAACGMPLAGVAWAKFLRKALRDETIGPKTPISYFLGEK